MTRNNPSINLISLSGTYALHAKATYRLLIPNLDNEFDFQDTKVYKKLHFFKMDCDNFY